MEAVFDLLEQQKTRTVAGQQSRGERRKAQRAVREAPCREVDAPRVLDSEQDLAKVGPVGLRGRDGSWQKLVKPRCQHALVPQARGDRTEILTMVPEALFGRIAILPQLVHVEIEKLTVRKDRGDFSAAWTQGVREATCQLGEHRDEIGEGQLLWSALAPFEELDDDARRGSTSRRKTPRSRIQWVACPRSQRISRFLAGAGSMRTP